MSILSLTASHEEGARQFCIELAREFAIRAKHHKPADARERRWLLEGIRPIGRFETIYDMLAEGLCK